MRRLGAILAGLLAAGCASAGGAGPTRGPAPPGRASSRGGSTERWGVEVQGIRLSAAGYMLDFRYRVTDAEKARPLFDRRHKPFLREQDSGATFAVPVPPKTGALRSTRPPRQGRTYFMFFANPGRFVKPGSRVTVTIGEFQAPDLVVQ